MKKFGMVTCNACGKPLQAEPEYYQLVLRYKKHGLLNARPLTTNKGITEDQEKNEENVKHFHVTINEPEYTPRCRGYKTVKTYCTTCVPDGVEP